MKDRTADATGHDGRRRGLPDEVSYITATVVSSSRSHWSGSQHVRHKGNYEWARSSAETIWSSRCNHSRRCDGVEDVCERSENP